MVMFCFSFLLGQVFLGKQGAEINLVIQFRSIVQNREGETAAQILRSENKPVMGKRKRVFPRCVSKLVYTAVLTCPSLLCWLLSNTEFLRTLS